MGVEAENEIPKHLNEETLSTERIFEGKVVNLRKDKVLLESGRTSYREVIEHNGGVCVLPLTDDDEIIFVRQFRYPFKTVLLELPAGKREGNEEPINCGIRELKEEVGATAEKITYLGNLYPTVAYDTEIIYMYMAEGLDFGEQNLDPGEFIDVVKIPFEKAVEMVMNGEIPDSKTQLAILKANMMRK
ncbi:MAG: NUDIX hydrolase [Oscillospiraceae bacterium]|nr:NUDIX hydrolase [Oscillospiraceae bacterium]